MRLFSRLAPYIVKDTVNKIAESAQSERRTKIWRLALHFPIVSAGKLLFHQRIPVHGRHDDRQACLLEPDRHGLEGRQRHRIPAGRVGLADYNPETEIGRHAVFVCQRDDAGNFVVYRHYADAPGRRIGSRGRRAIDAPPCLPRKRSKQSLMHIILRRID